MLHACCTVPCPWPNQRPDPHVFVFRPARIKTNCSNLIGNWPRQCHSNLHYVHTLVTPAAPCPATWKSLEWRLAIRHRRGLRLRHLPPSGGHGPCSAKAHACSLGGWRWISIASLVPRRILPCLASASKHCLADLDDLKLLSRKTKPKSRPIKPQSNLTHHSSTCSHWFRRSARRCMLRRKNQTRPKIPTASHPYEIGHADPPMAFLCLSFSPCSLS